MAEKKKKAAQLAPGRAQKQSKTARVNAEIKRLEKSFKDLPQDVAAIAEGLVREAANMRVTLEIWRTDLDTNGWVEMFQQSEKVAPYEKKRAVAEMYLNLNPNYQKIIDKLVSYLPKTSTKPLEVDDGFENFVQARE